MKNLLILGASSLQVSLIDKAKKLGFNTIALDLNPDAPGTSVADEFYPVSTIDSNKVLQVAREKNIVGIVTTSDFPVRVVAFVSEALGLHGVSARVAEICTNKSLQRELLKKESFLYPKFQLIKDQTELETVIGWDYPLIIKPVDSSASRGVQKILSSSEVFEAYEQARENSKCGDVIIEEFIEGNEYSVETLIQNNEVNIIAITEKVTSGQNDKFFVEEVHIVPASLSKDQQVQIEKEITRFVSVLGLNNSAAHIEFKSNSRGIYIIEIAARLGGDFITSDLVPLATGVDMLKAIISISVGQKIDVEKKENNFAGIHFLTPDNYDAGKKHLENIAHVVGVEQVLLEEKKDGAILRSSFDRLGHFIVKASSREDLDRLLKF